MNTSQKKNFISFCAMAILILTFLFIVHPIATVVAEGPTPIPTKMSDTTISLEVSKAQVNPGDTFDLTMMINTDAQTRGAQFEISFNPGLVELDSNFEEGGFYRDFATANGASTIVLPEPVIDNQAGTVQLIGISILGLEEGKGGPTGSGSLIVLHGKALPGANGNVQFKLGNVIVADEGDATGNTAALGGVKVQDGVIAIGSGKADAAPEARQATAPGPQVKPTATFEPTVAKRTSLNAESSANGSIPWEIIIPALGAVVLLGVGFFVLRKR